MFSRKSFLLFWALILFASVPGEGSAAEGPNAFREITFGDSQKSVRLKTLQDNFFTNPMVNLGNKALSPRGKDDLIIDGHSFQLIFFFNQAGLYRLDMMGEPRDGDQFESLRETTETLKTVLLPGMDEPSNSRRIQSTEDLQDGFTTLHYWSSDHTPGRREVFVGITSREEGYKASLILKDPSRADQSPLSSDTSSPPNLTTDEAAHLFSSP